VPVGNSQALPIVKQFVVPRIVEACPCDTHERQHDEEGDRHEDGPYQFRHLNSHLVIACPAKTGGASVQQLSRRFQHGRRHAAEYARIICRILIQYTRSGHVHRAQLW
jgi:hypothetical protein